MFYNLRLNRYTVICNCSHYFHHIHRVYLIPILTNRRPSQISLRSFADIVLTLRYLHIFEILRLVKSKFFYFGFHFFFAKFKAYITKHYIAGFGKRIFKVYIPMATHAGNLFSVNNLYFVAIKSS